jgi:hypothetical protein
MQKAVSSLCFATAVQTLAGRRGDHVDSFAYFWSLVTHHGLLKNNFRICQFECLFSGEIC